MTDATIPPEQRLWSLATIAEYAGPSVSHVAQRIACRPDFPRPIRVDGIGKPRWKGAQVMQWFERQAA